MLPDPIFVLKKYSIYTDKELLAAIAKNDKSAFAELFNRHWCSAYDTAYAKTANADATEEIVQELFVTLWDKRETVLIQNFTSYLFISIKNKCLNFLASQAVQQKNWEVYKTLISQTADRADKQISYEELLDQIEQGMEGLPEKTQQIFRLNRLEGHSVSEIATVLNLSEKAIEYHLTRSLKQLRSHLKDYHSIIVLSMFLF